MKALTIQQPWAWAILHAGKMIENRTWPTNHRGTLLIHAGKSTAWMDRENPLDWPGRYGVVLPRRDEFTFGALLGVVELVNCKLIDEVKWLPANEYYSNWAGSPFAEGPICWLLRNPQPFARPIPWKGAQGLWGVPDEVVREALEGVSACVKN